MVDLSVKLEKYKQFTTAVQYFGQKILPSLLSINNAHSKCLHGILHPWNNLAIESHQVSWALTRLTQKPTWSATSHVPRRALRFLSLCDCNIRFFSHFAHTAAPLTSRLKKWQQSNLVFLQTIIRQVWENYCWCFISPLSCSSKTRFIVFR